MPLAGAAENQNLANNDLEKDLNNTLGNNTITNQNLAGMSNEEIAKLKEWLKNKNFNASITNNNLTINNLTIGTTGENVVQLQKWLKEHGFYAGEIDGQFGNATQQAVKLFQNTTGIVEDGWVGILTLKAMKQWEQIAGKETYRNDTEKISKDSTSSSKTSYSTSKNTKKYRSTRGYSYSSKKGTGDCWDNSAYLYGHLTSSGTKARIIQYGTSLSPRHRSVQVYQNGRWVDYNYKSNGYAKRYYATKSKPGMTVIK